VVKIRAILEWDEEAKSYAATCPELNFVSSCGDSREEAIANLKEAILLMLEPLPEHLLTASPSSEFVEMAV
jgi:predicted RNase H-like HicB family nuclease